MVLNATKSWSKVLNIVLIWRYSLECSNHRSYMINTAIKPLRAVLTF